MVSTLREYLYHISPVLFKMLGLISTYKWSGIHNFVIAWGGTVDVEFSTNFPSLSLLRNSETCTTKIVSYRFVVQIVMEKLEYTLRTARTVAAGAIIKLLLIKACEWCERCQVSE